MRYIFGGGGNYYIAISPYLPKGENGYIAIFQGDLLYSHFSAYPGKGKT